MIFRRRRVGAVLLLLVSILHAGGWGRASESLDLRWGAAQDVDGEPLSAGDADLKVVAFLGVECPLARLYGPRLSALANAFHARGVRVIGVNSNPQDTVEDVQESIARLDLKFQVLKDRDQSWARQFGATRTPEVFVVDADDRIRYQGRIDDQYEPGIARAAPQQHDLKNAIEALLAGESPPVTSTAPVGCLITILNRPRRPSARSEPVTFTRDVAPVLNRHCVECHRPGEIGPFSLVDYDEAVGWGEMMLEVIEQGRMPPWHADPRYGEFIGARQMPEADRQILADWVAQEMPRGLLEDLPALPEQTSGWQLPTPPDAEFVMRDRPFNVPAEGTVEYQYFVVDPGWTAEQWVRAVQVAPGDAAVVHHAIVFVRAPDGGGVDGIGWLGGYVPGQRSMPLPAGHARRIPAGSKLVFQMHYTPNGEATADVTKVGVWFSDADEVTHEVTTRVALNHDFEIPPGVKDHAVDLRLQRFSQGSRLLGATPHMHLRGKSFRLAALRDGQLQTLLNVPNYDFNWQHWYHFQTPIGLDDVAALEMEVHFDNSQDNPANPDPDEFVTWGDQTWQEMAVAFFDVAHPRDQPRVWVRQDDELSAEGEAARLASIAERTDRFMTAMDADGDGVILKEEAPDAFRIFAFRRMDQNRDDRLDRAEVEVEAARRQ